MLNLHRFMTWRSSAAVLVGLGFACGGSAAPISKVIAEGDTAPLLGLNAIVGTLQSPVAPLNGLGQVAFQVVLDRNQPGIDLTNDQVFYRYAPGGAYTVVARGGDPIPGLPGEDYNVNSPNFLGAGSLNNLGDVVFEATPDFGLSTYFINGSATVVRRDDPAPGIAGAAFSAPFTGATGYARLNDAGQTLFAIRLLNVPGTEDTALYLDGTLIAQEGMAAPGTAAGFGTFNAVSNARLNNSGDVAFIVDLNTGNAADNGVVYKYSGGLLSLIARDGEAAPGAGGAVFASTQFGSLRQNSSGDIAYVGQLVGGDQTIYVNQTLRVRDGDAAPGLPGVTHDLIVAGNEGTIDFNDTGNLLYAATLGGAGVTAANNRALFLDNNLIAREGDASPYANTTIADFLVGDLALNASGEAVFLAQLAGAGVNGANDLALLGWTGMELVELVREGDVVPGGTISSLIQSGASGAFELNDAGEVLFFAILDGNREGLFTTVVPEPHALALFSLAVTLMVTRRGVRRDAQDVV